MDRLHLREGTFPHDIMRDIEKIESILVRHGALKIILYGSLARGDYHIDSDIDICFEGIPDDKYFRALAEILMETDRRVSMCDFEDAYGHSRERILREGKILYERQ
jgi:predicted nucleotidyltransferase